MDRPRVLIVEPREFDRRLMSDLVECNDMKATAVSEIEGNSVAEAEASRATIVVLDFNGAREASRKLAKKLRKLPNNPRIVGLVSRTSGVAGTLPADVSLEEVLPLPLDTGDFARAISRQAFEARRANLV